MFLVLNSELPNMKFLLDRSKKVIVIIYKLIFLINIGKFVFLNCISVLHPLFSHSLLLIGWFFGSMSSQVVILL